MHKKTRTIAPLVMLVPLSLALVLGQAANAGERPKMPALPSAANSLPLSTSLLHADNPTSQGLLKYIRNTFPKLNPETMVKFYQQYNPDVLREFKEKCDNDPEAAQKHLRRMARHFLKISRLQKNRPEEHTRLLEIERMDSKMRQLTRKIRDWEKTNPKAAQIPDARQTDISQTKTELKNLLDRIFAATQQKQLIEINRLRNLALFILCLGNATGE